jgi:hypothetical protein
MNTNQPTNQESVLGRVLKDGKLRVSQAVANEFSGFNTQRFRLAAVGWLVENNHPLSEFKSPAFRRLIAMASSEAEAALWTSHMSVSRYVLRLYDYLTDMPTIKSIKNGLRFVLD